MPRIFAHAACLCLAAISLAGSASLHAEIYKYRDEHGRWQFSDEKPEEGKAPVEVLQAPPLKAGTISNHPDDGTQNYLNQLANRFHPDSPLDWATLAVVSIQTPLGSGSGFFASANGYIVTNRHVIRPRESTGWEETRRRLEEEEKTINRRLTRLDSERARLRSVKKTLDRMWDEVQRPDLYHNPTTPNEYYDYRDAYQRDREQYQRLLKETRERRADYRDRATRFKRRSANATIARHFKVFLKDGTELQAELVSVAPDADLALIRVNAKTPYLKPASPQSITQGTAVYAIGSPLGQQDSVTSGIVTRMTREGIFTDAQILPGNSGGPLINEAGELLGVNTRKLMAGKQHGAEGFGIAIPATRIREIFPGLLEPR